MSRKPERAIGLYRAYLRKMAVSGYIIQIDFTLLKEIVLLLRNVSSNINQIACRVNATGNFYEDDFQDIKEKNKQLLDGMCILLEKVKQW